MIRYFSAHPTAANLLMILLLASGLISLPTFKRETFPDFSVDVVQVQVVWPGAAAAEVEEALCQRIEDAVEGLTGAEEVRCEAREKLEVTKTKDQDTLTVMRAVERFVEDFRATAPPGVEIILTRDVASIVENRLDMLLENGIAGVIFVFLVLWLFFSFRFSFWVAMGLPAFFLGALFGMTLIGYSINMMTMVALLIAAGLLMDDSIVIAENIASHLQQGKLPLAAATAGTREVAPGVLSSFARLCAFSARWPFSKVTLARCSRWYRSCSSSC